MFASDIAGKLILEQFIIKAFITQNFWCIANLPLEMQRN